MSVRVLCATFAVTLGVLSLIPASAQAQQSSADVLEEVVVTGSRLARPGSEAPIPVTSVSAEDIEISGATLISDYLGDLPQFGINQGRMTEISGQATNAPLTTVGAESLNLRDLGVQRTLVVVDGRRHVGSVAGSTVVDVGSIPTALIERVEVSTGGASVAYGADAVAGVVNFIMKKDFEGLQLDARYGDSHQGGGDNTYLSLTAGGNFADGRGNAVISTSYNELGGIEGYQRDHILERWGWIGNPADTGPNDGIPSQILTDGTVLTNLIHERGMLYGLVTDTQILFDEAGPRPGLVGVGTAASGTIKGGDGMDLVKNQNIATPMDRISLLGRVNYALTDNTEFFLEGKFYSVDAEVRAPPMLDAVVYTENSQLFLVDRANPFLPQNSPLIDQFFDSNPGSVTMARVHYDDLGRRDAHVDRDLYRIVTGIEGETGFRDWNFDLFFQYGEATEKYQEMNNRDPRRFRLATDAVVDVTGVTGVAPGSPACRATVLAAQAGGTEDPDVLNCRPVNLFGLGLASQESLDYMMVDLQTDRSLQQIVAGASLTGTLFEVPAGPVSFAAGLEYRDEESETLPDAQQQSGETFAGQFLPVRGTYDVMEGFVEARLPILSDKPFARTLAVEGGFRYSDYNVTGGTSSWRFGAEWAPGEQLRFRGMYSKAVRAPGIDELFAPHAPTFAVPADPCLPANINLGPDPERRLANCQADLGRFGVDPLTWDPDENIRDVSIGVLGGNPDLTEETAKSLTFGFVYQPEFFDNMSLTVDYYDVEIEDVIVAPLDREVVNNCYDRFDSLDNEFCHLMERNDGSVQPLLLGQLDEVILISQNFNTLTTSGVDVEFNYGFELEQWVSGGFNLRLIANYLNSYEILSYAAATQAEEYAGSTRRPEWRGQMQLMYYTDALRASYRLRYVDGVRLRDLPAANPIEDRFPAHVGAETISDVHLAYDFGARGASDGYRMELYAGIDNLFDSYPPPGIRTGRNSASSTYYDPMGRYYYGGVKVNF